jgi:hypothetical protein
MLKPKWRNPVLVGEAGSYTVLREAIRGILCQSQVHCPCYGEDPATGGGASLRHGHGGTRGITHLGATSIMGHGGAGRRAHSGKRAAALPPLYSVSPPFRGGACTDGLRRRAFMLSTTRCTSSRLSPLVLRARPDSLPSGRWLLCRVRNSPP